MKKKNTHTQCFDLEPIYEQQYVYLHKNHYESIVNISTISHYQNPRISSRLLFPPGTLGETRETPSLTVLPTCRPFQPAAPEKPELSGSEVSGPEASSGAHNERNPQTDWNRFENSIYRYILHQITMPTACRHVEF